jgi:hypothetical protein
MVEIVNPIGDRRMFGHDAGGIGHRAISSGLVGSDLNGPNLFQVKLFFGHGNRDFRAVGLRKPRLVLQSRRDGAIADFMRIAEFIEIEQFGRQRLAAGMALTFVLVDTQPQLGGFRHSTNSLCAVACERFAERGNWS